MICYPGRVRGGQRTDCRQTASNADIMVNALHVIAPSAGVEVPSARRSLGRPARLTPIKPVATS